MHNQPASLARRRPSAGMEGADSPTKGRRDGMVTNPKDGNTAYSRTRCFYTTKRIAGFDAKKYVRSFIP